MSQELTDAIVKHILFNLGATTEVFERNSITNTRFLTDHQIEFDDEQGITEPAYIWACETTINHSKFRMMCVIFDCQHTKDADKEVAVLVKLPDCPTYGIMASNSSGYIDEAFIACEIKDKMWVKTTSYIQATFLAGMEQLKELSAAYEKCEKTDDLFLLLKEFIAYRTSFDSEEA